MIVNGRGVKIIAGKRYRVGVNTFRISLIGKIGVVIEAYDGLSLMRIDDKRNEIVETSSLLSVEGTLKILEVKK